MANPTELERLVVVETKLDAVIEQNKLMTAKLDDLLGSYVPRAEYEKDMKDMELKIERAKKRTSLQTWVTGSLSALFGAILMYLITFFITHIGKV